jgi:hypothetical protein
MAATTLNFTFLDVYTVGARWNRGSDHLSFQLHNGERWSASKQPLRLGAQGMYDDGARK